MGDYTLLHGDCLEADPVPGVVLITDPPYGTATYQTDTDGYAALRAMWDFGTAAVFGYPERLVGFCIKLGVAPSEWVTWWPTNKVGGRSLARLPKESECIAVFGETPGASELTRERSANKHGALRSEQRGLSATTARLGDVWRDPSPGVQFNWRLRQHPNEKPLSLMKKLVVLLTNPGDTVYDPFMGSGTTGVAAIEHGRYFIGCEIDEGYFTIARRRIEAASAQGRLPV